jgi:hypothetical protein
MKVFTYNIDDRRFMSGFLPTDATEVIVYDSRSVMDQSAIYSNAIEQNDIALKIISLWVSKDTKTVYEIDAY